MNNRYETLGESTRKFDLYGVFKEDENKVLLPSQTAGYAMTQAFDAMNAWFNFKLGEDSLTSTGGGRNRLFVMRALQP